MSSMFRLNRQDLVRGVVVAVGAVILGGLQQRLTTHGLDFASYDWGSMLNMALVGGGAYLSKNLLSDSDGKVLGKI